MSRVLIIGAGGVGRVVTHKCAQQPEVFSDIWLASRTLSKCEQIASEIGGDRVKTAQVDADNVPEVERTVSSVTTPVAVPLITGASSVPVTVTVTVWVTDSPSTVVASTVKVSATVSPPAKF